MFDVALCVTGLSAKTPEEVVRALARLLADHGYVSPEFEEAAVARERRSPTGLPFPDMAIALPHAEPEHVRKPGVAIATLASPVRFREMGSPARTLEVSLVLMPALTAKEQAASGLSYLLGLLQDAGLRAALVGAPSPKALYDAVAGRWRR